MPAQDSFGITPSVYGSEAMMLELADNYLSPGTYSTLRAGFFGYSTGAMARVSAEGAYHRNVLYKEGFLNTASLPSSIFNYAKIYEITPGLATPSTCSVLLGFYIDDLQAAMGSSSGTFIIPRGQQVFLGTTPFVVAGEVDLVLGGFDGNNNQIVSASYNAAQMDFPSPTLPGYVRTYVLTQASGTSGTPRSAVYLQVQIVQALGQTTEFQVVQSSALETLYYDVTVPAGGQLAGFTVLYRGPTDAAQAELPAYFNESLEPTVASYCYYSYADDQTLEIYFSPISGSFRPAYNSTLDVVCFTSLGAAGNFDFSGAINVTLPAPYRSLAVLTELVTQPSGGADKQTILQLKQAIQLKVLARNSIIIESDLESYLSGTVTAADVNASRVEFVKLRDDIQTRTFNAFLLAADSAGRYVPTNSVPLDLEVADLDARGWSIKPGTVVIFDRVQQIFRLLQLGEFPDQMVGDPNNFVYSVPYLMVFFTAPYPRLSYYLNMAAVDQGVTQGPGDFVTGDSFLASSITINRNAAVDDTYQIDLAVVTSLATAADVAANVLCRVNFLDPANANNVIGYAEMPNVPGTGVFRASVSTEDEFDSLSNMVFPNTLFDGTGNYIPLCSVPQSVNLRVDLFYYSANPSTAGMTVTRGGMLFQRVSTFTTSEPVSFYQNLDSVMASSMYVTTQGTFHADQVPLVGAQYFLNPRLGQGLLSIFSAYRAAILNAFSLLANNTSVSIKLFNSYGPSQYYSVDRVNLSIAMSVSAAGVAAGGSSSTLTAQIQAATSAFVAGCSSNALGRFSTSNLTTVLETTVGGINYIRSITVNGVATQSTQRIISDAALQQDNKQVPEFLGVGTVLTNNLSSDPYAPDVTVTYI
jgi:hypothetical protein